MLPAKWSREESSNCHLGQFRICRLYFALALCFHICEGKWLACTYISTVLVLSWIILLLYVCMCFCTPGQYIVFVLICVGRDIQQSLNLKYSLLHSSLSWFSHNYIIDYKAPDWLVNPQMQSILFSLIPYKPSEWSQLMKSQFCCNQTLKLTLTRDSQRLWQTSHS